MVEVAHVRVINIVSVAQGANTYKGVRSVSLSVNDGQYIAKLAEGMLYPTGMDNVGTPDFPVRTSITFEQSPDNVLDLLAEAAGSLVITVKVDGGGENQVITIVNHKFERPTTPFALQSPGVATITGFAYSANGTTLPISVA